MIGTHLGERMCALVTNCACHHLPFGFVPPLVLVHLSVIEGFRPLVCSLCILGRGVLVVLVVVVGGKVGTGTSAIQTANQTHATLDANRLTHRKVEQVLPFLPTNSWPNTYNFRSRYSPVGGW